MLVLYSVGLDGADDGGKLPLAKQHWMTVDGNGFFLAPKDEDIVWPKAGMGGP